MATIAVLVGVIAVMIATGSGAGSFKPEQGALPRIHRTLTVATVEGALPLSGTLPDGQLGGYHVAVARAVCARLGVSCRFALTAPDDLLTALTSGAVDMVAADVIVRPGETSDPVVTAPPHARRSSIWVISRSRLAADTAGFAAGPNMIKSTIFKSGQGRVVAVVSGSDQATALKQWELSDVTVVLAERPEEVLDALRDGEVDAALLPLSVALAFLFDPTQNNAADFSLMGKPMIADGAGGLVSLVLPAGDTTLVRAVDGALDALRREGRLLALARETLPVPEAVVPVAMAGSLRGAAHP